MERFDVPDDVRRDAERTEDLIRKKLLEIMDLQGDIDSLLRDKHPSPFGSAKWKNARCETLQRLVLMTAIQFVLFEPKGWVQGNDKFKVAAEAILEVILAQIDLLRSEDNFHEG